MRTKRTYKEISLNKSVAELAAYDLTLQDWQAIQDACRLNLDDAHDGIEHCASQLAELVAMSLDHDDWLDEGTHPIWDAAAAFCTEVDEFRTYIDAYVDRTPNRGEFPVGEFANNDRQ